MWNEVVLTVLLSRVRDVENSSNRLPVVLRSMARGAMSRRKADRSVQEIEDPGSSLGGALRAMLNPGHHVRATISRGAEASSRSEGLAYARSERSVEP